MFIYAIHFLASRGTHEADMCITFVCMVFKHNCLISVAGVQVVSAVFFISFYFNLLFFHSGCL